MKAIDAALAGLGRAEASLERTAQRMARLPAAVSEGGDEVSLSDEMVSLIQARNVSAVNLKAIQAAAEMEREILDLLG